MTSGHPTVRAATGAPSRGPGGRPDLVGTAYALESSDVAVHSEAEPSLEVERLREFAGREVRLRLVDGSEHRGVLRTDLLSEHSISVFIALPAGEGATIYIDQIVDIRFSN